MHAHLLLHGSNEIVDAAEHPKLEAILKKNFLCSRNVSETAH